MSESVLANIDIIIPVRNGAELLPACLSAVMPHLCTGDRVIVVDDASNDDSASIALDGGAVVMTLDKPCGPYAARQYAAMKSEAEYLVFTDVRCRPLPGWLEAHRRMLSMPGVALSCSDVAVLPGKSFASRVAAVQQPFRVAANTTGARLPYYPTCNLGVNRAAFFAVGGFPNVRSGGDAEICWRIQTAGLGKLAIEPGTFATWEPRQRLRGLTEQWFRYGVAGARLDAEYPHANALGDREADVILRSIVESLKSRSVSPAVALAAVALFALQRISYLVSRLGIRAGVVARGR